MAEEREGAVLIGICPTCTVVRLKSKFPIAKQEDCKPENFMGVDGAPDPSGEVPLCHECSAVLKFAKEAGLVSPPKTIQDRQYEAQLKVQSLHSEPLGGSETLFEAREGEQVFNIYPDTLHKECFIVITDRRILRIKVY